MSQTSKQYDIAEKTSNSIFDLKVRRKNDAAHLSEKSQKIKLVTSPKNLNNFSVKYPES